MRALISGSEQGLGARVRMDLLKEGYDTFNLPRELIVEGKYATISHELLHTIEHDGAFDIVINNFGVNHLSKIGETAAQDADILRTNVMMPYWIVNELVRHSNGPARVVNVASQTYRVPQRTTALYCASKAALVHLTKVMARELAPSGWVINAIAPGKIVDTEMSEKTDAQVQTLREWTEAFAEQYALRNIPIGRFTSCVEVSQAIMDMLNLPNYINGTVIDMTGGV